MDTSPKYVDMCEKAIEIQTLRPIFVGGDFFSCDDHLFIQGDMDENTHTTRFQCKNDIWLPRQDQLQELHMDKSGIKSIRECLNLLGDIKCFLGILNNAETMEQLQLQVLMFNLYNKRWDGHKWINRNNMVPIPYI
jgi:hypothetical protein